VFCAVSSHQFAHEETQSVVGSSTSLYREILDDYIRVVHVCHSVEEIGCLALESVRMQETIEVSHEMTIKAWVGSTSDCNEYLKVFPIGLLAPESVWNSRWDVDCVAGFQGVLFAIKKVVHRSGDLKTDKMSARLRRELHRHLRPRMFPENPEDIVTSKSVKSDS
jgi:hypothetical protein